jgi:signal peptidase I
MLALVIALVLRCVLLEGFKIPSGSMLPTLQIGDYVLVNKLRFGVRVPGTRRWLVWLGGPQPGDVIVFDDRHDPARTYVKRVIAVAGEVVEIRDKQVLVNGVPRDVPSAYSPPGGAPQRDTPRDNFGPARVPRRRVFVLGDNRDQSFDSRYTGFVDARDVQGTAVLVYWSADSDDGWVRWERLGRLIR